jgi:hypothetical protein
MVLQITGKRYFKFRWKKKQIPDYFMKSNKMALKVPGLFDEQTPVARPAFHQLLI